MVFLGSAYKPLGVFYALDADTGEQLWNYSTGRSRYGIGASPAYHDGVVYIGSNNGKMYAFNATNGTHLWNYSTGDTYNGIYSSPVYAEGRLYFGSSDNFLYCMNASSGKVVWSYRSGGFGEYGCVATPAIVSGRLYVGFTGDNSVYCFGNTIVPTIDLDLKIIPKGTGSTRDHLYAGEDVDLQITAKGEGEGVEGVDVELSVEEGEVSRERGVTGSTGVYSTSYTAPTVGSTKEIEITVKAEAVGYLTNESLFLINVVLNPALESRVEGQMSGVLSESSNYYCITAIDGTTPLHNVTIEIRTTGGELSPIKGITNENGTVCFTYTAPELDENSTVTTVTIHLRLIKSGYETGRYEVALEIIPPPSKEESEVGIDWVMAGLVGAIIVLIVAIVAFITIKGKKYW
jgi:hypothetical protein